MAQKINAKYELKLSDAYQLVSTNIMVNKMSIENLQMQQDYLRMQADLYLAARLAASKKAELIEKLNTILEQQLNEYCEIRQDACKLIIEDINALDIYSSEQNDKIRQMHDLHDKMCIMVSKINNIKSGIPETVTVTNYRIRPKPDVIGSILDPMV
jgi:hypothetical protein